MARNSAGIPIKRDWASAFWIVWCLVIPVVLLAGYIYIAVWAPCSTLGWMSVSAIPTRCLVPDHPSYYDDEGRVYEPRPEPAPSRK